MRPARYKTATLTRCSEGGPLPTSAAAMKSRKLVTSRDLALMASRVVCWQPRHQQDDEAADEGAKRGGADTRAMCTLLTTIHQGSALALPRYRARSKSKTQSQPHISISV